MSTIALRILPVDFVIRRPQRMIERHVVAYRRQWLIVVSGFFEPLFYLLSMRAGLGDLVGTVSVGGHEVPYDQFVAPALMAASAMNGAVFDSTGNVLHRLKYARIYDAALATPMGPADVATGEIGWALIRGQLYACSFLVVMVALGLVDTWWSLLALPACALIGAAFAGMGFAATTYMRGWQDMEIVNTATMPLFMFSAVFFPVAAYGQWEWLVQLSPLYHGVVLVRAACAGVWTSTLIVHALVLAVITVAALTLAARRLDTLLRQ
ncbi:MAG TPA: ABC transporter permease [Ilumatobacteraceae bacterium]|nr:ABC transporter permease [Ilumatobacteraceae bacterium]